MILKILNEFIKNKLLKMFFTIDKNYSNKLNYYILIEILKIKNSQAVLESFRK
jgi:hypothetical protein